MWMRRWIRASGTLCRQRQSLRWRSATSASSPPTISPVLLSRARVLAAEHAQLSDKLQGQYDAQIAKKVGSLSTVASIVGEWEAATNTLPELVQVLNDPSTDAEFCSLAQEDLDATHETLRRLSNELQTSLIPIHPFADLPCFIEIRPGTGGKEAGLFTKDLLHMYIAYCKIHRLRANVINLDMETATKDEQGYLEAILEIDAPGAYDRFRCESGVHRVQRVPATAKAQVKHTSTASVLVLPVFPASGTKGGADDIDNPASDYYIHEDDVHTDTMRSSGAGGQHVNVTDSAVRLTHRPTRTSVLVQDQRNQAWNKSKAWKILRSKLAQKKREAKEEEAAALRGNRVGRLGRGGDKARTYSWLQSRVTDHRAELTLHNLENVMEGGESLDKMMDAVREWLKSEDLEMSLAVEDSGEGKKEETKKSRKSEK